MTSRRIPRAAAFLLALLSLGALAAAAAFDFTAHGAFRRMLHSGDASGKVALAALPQGAGRWGVGALAALEGEIVQIDGRLLVSRGRQPQGLVEPPRADDQAALFASAQVQGWVDVPVPRELDAAAFETFLVEQARARGIDTAQAFPFLVEGRWPVLIWHVLTGDKPQGGGHGGGHANHRAGLRVFEEPGAEGRLVAVYSGSALEGVVSHPGERLHVHFVDAGGTRSGHVDRFSVGAGATLRLPR